MKTIYNLVAIALASPLLVHQATAAPIAASVENVELAARSASPDPQFPGLSPTDNGAAIGGIAGAGAGFLGTVAAGAAIGGAIGGPPGALTGAAVSLPAAVGNAIVPAGFGAAAGSAIGAITDVFTKRDEEFEGSEPVEIAELENVELAARSASPDPQFPGLSPTDNGAAIGGIAGAGAGFLGTVAAGAAIGGAIGGPPGALTGAAVSLPAAVGNSIVPAGFGAAAGSAIGAITDVFTKRDEEASA
ncbi:hypothetical protein HK102_008366 [Quaeritorhiza haematococci]|nr:hypothetical protein HK102_008366 [Quaeritorhiza haematococci]